MFAHKRRQISKIAANCQIGSFAGIIEREQEGGARLRVNNLSEELNHFHNGINVNNKQCTKYTISFLDSGISDLNSLRSVVHLLLSF